MSEFNESEIEETALASTEPTEPTAVSDEEACEHDHAHDHDHNSCPAERIVTPGDIFDIDPTEESIVIIGTQQKKVTKITGLDDMVQLKVVYMSVASTTHFLRSIIFDHIGTGATILFD